jgi:hypothetical protein
MGRVVSLPKHTLLRFAGEFGGKLNLGLLVHKFLVPLYLHWIRVKEKSQAIERYEIHDPVLIAWAEDSGRRGTQRSGIKEEANGRGTAAELSATPT